jgi:putative NADH-flavin reductase
MNKKNKIAVIGGTGKSGKYLVKELLHKGYCIKLLHRNPENISFENPSVEIVKGDARNDQSIRTLLCGCQAVISTLGQPKGEASIFSQATKNVIQAMKVHGIRRYILTTGLNVDTPFDQKSPKTKFATDWMKTNYQETTTDKQLEYNTLLNSDIDWTLVRLPLIEQTEERRELLVNLNDCPGDKISAADLAGFLIEQLTDDSFIKKAPFIANI